MKKSEAKFDVKDIETVNISILNGQVNLILRALELYSHNLEYMLNDEGVDTETRQNKIAMLKYTYEVILVNQAEQVNNKTNFSKILKIKK